MNPYLPWVDALAALLREGAALQPPAPVAPPPTTGPLALIFAPHPDDEVIVGALPLRLRREAGWRVTNVAVTLGSRLDRREARRQEAAAACAALGFGLLTPRLAAITPTARAADPAAWTAATATIADLLARERPTLILFPHADDWNQTHLGTHRLVTDAMATLPELDVLTVETEFWGAMAAPNLMVEMSAADLADLVAALALHTGEVARNPYHLRLPAWMMDNVRRGAELVGGQGGIAPDIAFATLYRLRAWRAGGWRDVLDRGRLLTAADPVGAVIEASLFPEATAR